MVSDKVRKAAAMLSRLSGKGATKRRGDAAYYAKLRLSRPGTVTIEDMRFAANILRDYVIVMKPGAPKNDILPRVAAWLEREADRRERINQKRHLTRHA